MNKHIPQRIAFRYKATAMRLVFVAAMLCLATTAKAQVNTSCPTNRVLRDGGGVDAQPYIPASAKLTYQVRFPGRTMTGGSLTWVVKAGTDANPSQIVSSAPSASGEYVTFTLYPDAAGTAGARNGNSYLVTLLATSASEIVPVDMCLRVQKSNWKP